VAAPAKQEILAWQTVVGAKPDGIAGPATQAATVAWLRGKGYLGPKPGALDPESARARVVSIALSELGERDPDRYWSVVCPAFVGHPHDKAWCGGFALWCLRQAGLCDWLWINAKGFLFRLPSVSLPEPGDIAYFAKGHHHAVVESAGNGRVYTIDGNSMPFPREGVTAKSYPIDPWVSFYSIRQLVSAT
jgi:hypothetical protein